MRGVPWRARFRACPRDPLAILPIVAVLLLIIVPVMVATVGIAQEVRQGRAFWNAWFSFLRGTNSRSRSRRQTENGP